MALRMVNRKKEVVALLWIYRALLWICEVLLRIYRVHLQICRAFLKNCEEEARGELKGRGRGSFVDLQGSFTDL